MDPINPWLDPVEVRRLAERLMKPLRDAPVDDDDPGFDDDFVGYANARPTAPPPVRVPQNPAPMAPPPIRPVAAEPAGAVLQPERKAEPTPEAPPPVREPVAQPQSETIPAGVRGPFLDRIQRFRDWMHHHFAASGLFLLDREGSVIFDESNHGRLHFLARSLAQASRRQGSSGGNVHVKIGSNSTLEVIPVETAYGCLVLGAVVPEALPPSSVAAVMDALTQVASPPAAG